MRYLKGILPRKVITAVLGVVSLLWAVRAYANGAMLDVVLGLLFAAYAVFAVVRLARKKAPAKAPEKPINPRAAALQRIVRNVVDSDIVLYLFMIYIIARFAVPQIMNGILPSLYEIIFLIVILSGFIQSAQQVLGLDKYRKSESRRAWDIYEAGGARPPETASGIVCPHCGAPVRDKEAICKSCGRAMYAKKTAISMFACPRCKQPVSPDDRMCTSCGNIFIEGKEEEHTHVD